MSDFTFDFNINMDELIREFDTGQDWIKDELLDWIGQKYVKDYFDLVDKED